MPCYNLTQTLQPDKPARHYANGKRINRAEYERITTMARMYGQHDTFRTSAKQLPGGKFKRKNHSCARWRD